MNESIISILIGFLGGLGLFIYGMHLMAEGLQKAAGSRMKRLLEVLTNNRFLGVLVGCFVTGIIQSSSATTVMVVGFVNAGLMSLAQATSVIMGANIGTTVTSWIVAMGDWVTFLQPENMAPFALAIGVSIMITTKKTSLKNASEIIVGFGILFVGISAMSGAAEPLKGSPALQQLFVNLGSSPLLGILAGTIVTAIIQSSSASVGILQTLAATGLVPFGAAVYIIMGQNIGTCITAILSSIGASKNAKSAAYIHLLFNIIGSIVFSLVAVIYFIYINPVLDSAIITRSQISIVHTLFNIANTVMLFPFSNAIIMLAKKMAKVDDTIIDESSLFHLDDRMLETPSFAVQNSLKEVARMGHLASESMHMSIDSIIIYDIDKINKIISREKNIDSLTDNISSYLIKVCNTTISEHETRIVLSLLNSVVDIERVGDHLENIAEFGQYMKENNIVFSDTAVEELKEIMGNAAKSFEIAIASLETLDTELAKETFAYEDKVDALEEAFRKSHIERLSKNQCNSTAGIIFLDILTNVERISDHALNIAETVGKIAK